MFARIASLVAAAGALAFAAAFSSAAAQDAQETTVLQPSSPWNLRYDEDKCRLVREFGEGANVVLMLDQTGSEPFYTLTLIGDELRKLHKKEVTLKFGPDEESIRRSFLYGEMPDGRRLVSLYGITLAPVVKTDAGEVVAIGAEREAAISTLSIGRSSDWQVVTLAIGSMASPLDALRTCVADLGTYLEVNRAAGERGPVPASDSGEWLQSTDYPNDMISRNEEATVSFRLTVDREGKPTACHIVNSTRPQGFDDAVCLALLTRAQFKPATDPQGNPRAAYFTGAVRFSIP